MKDWQKGSYYFPELNNQEMEINLLRQVSSTAKEFEKSIWAELRLEKNVKILDLGCGPGFVSIDLAKFFPTGNVVGVDLSQELLDHAQMLQKTEMLTNLSFKQSDIYNLDVGNNNFGLAYLRFVLQHLKSPVEALTNAAKALKTGGMLCVIDIDDDKSELHPCLPAFESFSRRAVSGQAIRGGDRNVGSKLEKYFLDAGLFNSQVNIRTLSSHNIGIKLFLDLIIKTRYPAILESQKEMASKEVEEIYSLADIPEAWGTMDIFVATGIKM